METKEELAASINELQSQNRRDKMVELLEKYGHEIQGIINVRVIEEDDVRDDPHPPMASAPA